MNNRKKDEDDLWEIFKVFAFAGIMTFIPFYIFEILIPFSEQVALYEAKCKEKGGFVFEQQNQDKMCIKKDIIIIIP